MMDVSISRWGDTLCFTLIPHDSVTQVLEDFVDLHCHQIDAVNYIYSNTLLAL